jgi:hypothetical protein
MLYGEQGELTWEQMSCAAAPAARIVADIPYERADGTHR